MNYEIKGGQFPVVILTLETGEKVFSEVGGMSWMTPNIKMETSTGGVLKGIARTFSGESLFLNYYTSQAANQSIAFASSFPGRIMPVELDGTNQIIAQKRAFLVATEGVNLETTFTKKFGAGFFGGEGFILQKFSGKGVAFLEIDGDVVEYNLQPGETMIVDQTHIAAMDIEVKFEIKTIKGVKNVLFGGEGLFVSSVTGPGRVWIQTMPVNKMLGGLFTAKK